MISLDVGTVWRSEVRKLLLNGFIPFPLLLSLSWHSSFKHPLYQMVSISPSEVPKIFLLPPLDLPPAANLFILQSSNTNGFLLLAALLLSCTLKRNSLEAANLQSSLCTMHSFIRVYPGEKFRRDIGCYNCIFSSGNTSDVCVPNRSSSF